MSKKPEFICATVGLQAQRRGRAGLVKAEYYRNADGSVTLRAVSGRSLASMPGSLTISGEDFADRPINPYNATREALWALRLLVYSVGEDDYGDE